MKRIDFFASSLTWLTKKGASYGRFLLDAKCTIKFINSEESETYYLAPAVVAGNVYAEDDLVKNPVYLFQIAASGKRHIIFRTFFSHKDDKNTFDNNSLLFREVEFNITRKEAVVLETFDDIDIHFQKHHHLSARLIYETLQNSRVEVEFPIKHININRKKKWFQVETGPILIPSDEIDGEFAKRKHHLFNTAFVHFNRFDRAELTICVPMSIGQEEVQVKKINSRIIMMINRYDTDL